MYPKLPILTIVLALIVPAPPIFASGAIEQRQQMMRQQQQEAIRRQQQQIIAQQQQAYQQAVLQRQAQQQVYQQALQQRAAQQQAYNQAVQERVKDIYQEGQAAMLQAQQQGVEQIRAAQQQAYQQRLQQAGVLMSRPQPANAQQVQAPVYGELFFEPAVEDVVDISQLWDSLEENSRAWTLMIDMEPKVLTVQRAIDRFRTKNIQIRKSAAHYVQLIDGMAFQTPAMLEQPFESIMKIVAIIEYDFDNGQDKDTLARQVFPDDKGFQANKRRLGM